MSKVMRAESVRDAAEMLWLEPVRLRWGRRSDATPKGWSTLDKLVLLPWRPMLVPTAPLAAGGMLLAKARPGLRLHERAARLGLAAGLAGGVVQRLCRDRLFLDLPVGHGTRPVGVTALLAEILDRPVSVGLVIGRRRVNRKPVLYVLDERGRLLAYGKVGWNPLTRELAAAEATTLAEFAQQDLCHVSVPDVLHHGPLGGLTLLVINALPVPVLARSPRAEQLVPAMRELAGVRGLAVEPLADGSWWEASRSALGLLPTSSAAEHLSRSMDLIEKTSGRQPVTLGRWHGDWTRWNMAMRGTNVLLWDFERSKSWAPLGFDAIHFVVHRVLERPSGEVAVPLGQLEASAARATARFGDQVAPGSLVFTAYLVELACRALSDAAALPSPWIERRAVSLVEAVAARGGG